MTPTVVQNSRLRQFALGALCTGMLMIVLDQTIVNVALPSIQHELGFSQSSLAWVVNAYLIAFAGLLLLAGRLGDLIGRKRIFLSGLAVFIGASMLCGLAGSQEMPLALCDRPGDRQDRQGVAALWRCSAHHRLRGPGPALPGAVRGQPHTRASSRPACLPRSRLGHALTAQPPVPHPPVTRPASRCLR
jgi:hypothetical protein